MNKIELTRLNGTSKLIKIMFLYCDFIHLIFDNKKIIRQLIDL